MICPNCGADMGDGYVCSYCGYEIAERAKEEQEKKISAVYIKIAKLLRKPVDQAKKLVIRTAKIVIAAVLFITAFTAGITTLNMTEKEFVISGEYKINELETFYKNKEFAEMNSLLENIEDNNKASYDKYRIFGDMYKKFTYAVTETANDKELYISAYKNSAESSENNEERVYAALKAEKYMQILKSEPVHSENVKIFKDILSLAEE